jgi:hypothetical protein
MKLLIAQLYPVTGYSFHLKRKYSSKSYVHFSFFFHIISKNPSNFDPLFDV